MWKFHRAMSRPFFSRDRVSHFDLFDRHASEAMRLMKERFREGYAIDFQDLVSRFTLDSATEFLCGHCVDSLSSGLRYPHNANKPELVLKSDAAEDFSRAFLDAQEIVANRLFLGWVWPLAEIFRNKTDPSMKIVDAYLDPILKEALKKNRNSPSEEKDQEDIEEDVTLLDHLVRHTSDHTVLHDELLNILVAGRDTTAATLSFAVYLLAMHPDVLSRLRGEVLTHIGPSRRPTHEDIRDMKFLRAVINETLRLFPAVPINQRTTVKATTWVNPDPKGKPIYIPAGTTTPYSVLLMHRRKDLWGPDADDFDPDRFIDERLKKYLTPDPFIFLPFNAGPRICLGQQFAYNEMSFFLIKLLQTVDSITLDPDSQPSNSRVPTSWKGHTGRQGTERVHPKSHLTMYAYGGLWVKMNEVTTA